MADLRRMHLAISKGMKLYCTVEQALEDVIVVSLKHKTKEFRGILLDSSQRHLPPGLTFTKDGDPHPDSAVTAGNSSAEVPDQVSTKDVKGATLACRYSYNHDPAKYNEQPLPTTPSISIRSARGKTVRNIRLRPRQTLCSKCKSMIHDNKQSKSPSKVLKPEGEAQGETNYHNTRYRAALSGKGPDANTSEPMMTRSGLRNRRLESNPKVLLENIRPKREVKSTAKRKTSPEADTGQKNKLVENSARRGSQQQEEKSNDSVDGVSLTGKSDVVSKTDSAVLLKSDDEGSRVMTERSVSLDNSSTLSQYNRQPVVRLDKSLVPAAHLEEREKIPTLQIPNVPRPSPAIKISIGDGAVLKIPPRLPGAEMKSPEGHSTAEESPVPNSPVPDPPPPLKKIKKASRKSRDKQRYRIVNDNEISAEPQLSGIKIAAHHRKHKRKHKHRHANVEDENFNLEAGLPPPSKFPSIITRLSVVPPVSDMNGNEEKKDSDIQKEDSESQVVEVADKVDRSSPSASDFTQTDEQTRTEDDPILLLDEDPLRIEGLPVPESAAFYNAGSSVGNLHSSQKDADQVQLKTFDFDDDSKENKVFPSASRISPSGSDANIWGSPVKIETPAFEIGGSPAKIEAPPFPTDDSQDALEIRSFKFKSSPEQKESPEIDDISRESSPPAWIEEEERKEEPPDTPEEVEKKDSVPYGTGVFEDLTPDEDEDNHDDQNISQPMYQLPLTKKPRLLYPWHQDEGGSAHHHIPNIAAYFPKNPARVITDSSSSLYQKGARVYQNGPATYFSGSSSSTSVYPNNTASAFPNSPATVFQNNPATRIQNSPTPMIQKSPVPIFQYSGSSRYQGSPGRRYGSSPSRRYHGVGESASRYTVIDGSSLGQSSLSRFQSHSHSDADPPVRYRNAGEGVSASDYRLPKDSEAGRAAAQFPGKFDGRAAVRYQPLGENSATVRYQSQSENSNTRLQIPEDADSVVRYQSVSESGSSVRFPASSERSSVPVYPGQGASQQKYYPSSGSSALSAGFTARQSVSDGNLPSHPHSQYKSLGSSDSRLQTQNDSRYPSSGSLASPLAVQTTRSSSAALYHNESENKGVVPLTTRFSDSLSSSASSGVFLTQNTPASQVPKFHNKLPAAHITQRSVSAEAGKSLGLGVSGSAQSQDTSASFYHDHKHDIAGSQGQGAAGLFRNQGQSGLILNRGQSVPGVSQSHPRFSTTNVSDSDDDSDSAVPGFIPTPNSSSSQLPSHIESDGSRPLMMKIQTQSLSKCYNGRGREIRVGDVVWGKVQGFPWWPGRIISITNTLRDHRDQDRIVTQICHVSWFGSSTMSHMPSEDLHPFLEDFSARHNKKKRGPYRAAIQQALSAAQSPQQSNTEPLQTVNLQDLVA